MQTCKCQTETHNSSWWNISFSSSSSTNSGIGLHPSINLFIVSRDGSPMDDEKKKNIHLKRKITWSNVNVKEVRRPQPYCKN